MSMALEVSLGEVQETLMIPLFARAEESRVEGLLEDPMAEEIVSSLNYDFQKLKNKPSLKGAVLRTISYDTLLLDILKDYPDATIVEIGCGLNTRFDRVDNGLLSWYDLDLPDVHELWKCFFQENDRRKFLPFSAFDESWLSHVQRKENTPVIFIAEASTIYFDENQNKKLFDQLLTYFPNSYFIVDTATEYFVNRQDKHDILKMYSARVKWTVPNPTEIEKWNPRIELIRELNFFKNPPFHYQKSLPWYYRLVVIFLKLFHKKAINQYQLNVFAIK